MCRYNTPDSGMAGVERVSSDALASLVPTRKETAGAHEGPNIYF